MPSVRLLTDMMAAPSSQSSGSASAFDLGVLEFLCGRSQQLGRNGAPYLARRHATDPVFGVGHIGGVGLVDFALLDARVFDG